MSNETRITKDDFVVLLCFAKIGAIALAALSLVGACLYVIVLAYMELNP